MTLKRELEILRGAPIKSFSVKPEKVPCIETSDPELLCKNPVVSVHMITYNHEPYIRQAIEGVVMQKTDFEFELVIGEDCSTDKTREICFEYQKKYPDKIRVLWWHENVSKLGGNGGRVTARCRGDFIAFCEGDDYWIDPLKLQRQYDVFCAHDNVSICFTGGDIYWTVRKEFREWNSDRTLPHGVIAGHEFAKWLVFGRLIGARWHPVTLLTASVMFRKTAYNEAVSKFDILKWQMALGDLQVFLALSLEGDAYCLPERTSVYRQVASGAMQTRGMRVVRDAVLVKVFFLHYMPSVDSLAYSSTYRRALLHRYLARLKDLRYIQRQRYMSLAKTMESMKCIVHTMPFRAARLAVLLGVKDIDRWIHAIRKVIMLPRCILVHVRNNHS